MHVAHTSLPCIRACMNFLYGKSTAILQVLEKTIENSQGFKGRIKKNKEKKIEWIFFLNIIGIIAKHLHVYISLNNKFSVQIMIVESFFSMSS